MNARILSRFAGVAAILLLTPSVAAQSPPKPIARISVTNVTPHQGFIVAALYSESSWGGRPVAVARAPADRDIVELTLLAPSAGRYGIRLFHDVDADGVLDANAVGIPTEPFGFSNNAPLQFGPPPFSAAAFEIGDGGAAQTITLLR